MGLEIVEMVMEIEETFDLSIPDEDAEHIRTPREVIDHVMAHLRPARESSCLSQTAFYRLRTAAVSCLEVPRNAVKPSTRWNELLPHWRRRAWDQICSGYGMPLALPVQSDTIGGTATSAAQYLARRSAGVTRDEVSAIVHRVIVKVYGFDIGDESYFVDY